MIVKVPAWPKKNLFFSHLLVTRVASQSNAKPLKFTTGLPGRDIG
jgi:hypothetical protein